MLDSPSRGVVLVMVQVKPSSLPGGGGEWPSPKALDVCWLIKSTVWAFRGRITEQLCLYGLYLNAKDLKCRLRL